MMNVLEVAIYAMVLSAPQPQPFECFAVPPDGVNCTNGLAATPVNGTGIAFNNGVSIRKSPKGEVSLSNGVATFYDATAWVSFKSADGSTIISARKTGTLSFKFSNGLHCETTAKQPEKARCWRP